jgi:hypothetical protein
MSPGVRSWDGAVRIGLEIGAGDRIRTGDIDLGKVALYQLSYSRVRGGKDLKGQTHCRAHYRESQMDGGKGSGSN